MINLNWKQHGDAWFSHYRAYMFRMRRTPSGWIVSRETPEGWMLIANGVSMGEVSAQAEEWVMH